MKNKIFFSLKMMFVAFTLLMLQQSCDSMVEVDLPNNQLNKEVVFTDRKTAYSALANIYASMREISPVSGSSFGPLLGTYTDDLDYYAMSDTNGVMPLYQNNISETNTTIHNLWSNAYKIIYSINSLLEGIEESSTINQADRDIIKGEGLFLRSLVYYYLQQVFGDLPLALSTNYTVNQSLIRSKKEEFFALLENDLKMSINLLSEEYRQVDRIYVNKSVSRLLLAKLYADFGEWNQSESVLRLIIQHPQYVYNMDLDQVFNKNGKHILWQMSPQNTNDATKEATWYYFNNSSPTMYALSNHLISSIEPNDLRFEKWITKVNFNGNSWYRSSKYKNTTSNTTELSIVFRLEEVYLLMGEVLLKQNKKNEAVGYINFSRVRAGLSNISITSSIDEIMEYLQYEFRVEYFAEMGHRFINLKRWGQLEDLNQTKPNWEKFNELWPLPQKELLLNQNLAPQNHGY